MQIIRQTRHSAAEHQEPTPATTISMAVGEDIDPNTTTSTSINNLNDSITTGNNDQDSYMGNGDDESADVSGSVSGVPDKIVVRVHQGPGTSGLVAVAQDEDECEPCDEDDDVSVHASFEIKPDGKSYKYPQLKSYYEFGPWVGRNRKAICRRCKHQSASSQPERLIRHLKRCVKLTDEERSMADEMLLESNARKKARSKSDSVDNDSEYHADDDHNNTSLKPEPPERPCPLSRKKTRSASVATAVSHTASKRAKKSLMDHAKKAEIDQALTRFIMCCRIPLKSIHTKSFIDFVHSLNPDYEIPSRETITNVLIPSLLNII